MRLENPFELQILYVFGSDLAETGVVVATVSPIER